MYGMQPNAYAQYAGYPGYQAYGQPAAAGAAVAPGGTPQQVSVPSSRRRSITPAQHRLIHYVSPCRRPLIGSLNKEPVSGAPTTVVSPDNLLDSMRSGGFMLIR